MSSSRESISKPALVVLVGIRRSGKTEVANYLRKTHGYKFIRYSTYLFTKAEPIASMLKEGTKVVVEFHVTLDRPLSEDVRNFIISKNGVIWQIKSSTRDIKIFNCNNVILNDVRHNKSDPEELGSFQKLYQEVEDVLAMKTTSMWDF